MLGARSLNPPLVYTEAFMGATLREMAFRPLSLKLARERPK